MEDKKFKIGDGVICIDSLGYYSKQRVERITKTQAILTNGTKLNIDRVEGTTAIGSGTWSRAYFYKSTEELEEKYKNYRLQMKLNNALKVLKVNSLSNQEILDLLVIVETINKK